MASTLVTNGPCFASPVLLSLLEKPAKADRPDLLDPVPFGSLSKQVQNPQFVNRSTIGWSVGLGKIKRSVGFEFGEKKHLSDQNQKDH